MWSRSTNASDDRIKIRTEFIDEGRDEVEADPRRIEPVKFDELSMKNNLSPEKIILKRKPLSLSKISRPENVEYNRRYKLQPNDSEDDNIKFVNVEFNELNQQKSNTEFPLMNSSKNSEKCLPDSRGTNYPMAELKRNLVMKHGSVNMNAPSLEKSLAQKTKTLEELESRFRHLSLEFDQKRHQDAMEIGNLKQENTTMQKALSERNEEFEKKSLDLSESKKALQKLETELSRMKVTLKEAEAKATSSESLQTRLEESESFVTILQKDKEQSMQRSHSTIEMLRQKNRELEETQSSLKSKADKLEKDLGEQKKERDSDKIRHKKEMQSSAIEGKKLRDENHRHLSLISKFQRQQEKYEASIRDLQNKVNEKDDEIRQRDEKLRAIYEQSHINLEEERGKSRSLNQQVLQLKDTITKRDSQISIGMDEKKENTEIIKSLKSNLGSVNKECESFKEEVQILNQQIVENEALKRIESNKLEEKISVIENLKKSLNRKENFIVSLQTELSELASCFQEHFNKDQVIRTLKRELETQKQTCADLLDQLEIEKKRKDNDAFHPYQSHEFTLDHLGNDDRAKVFVGAIEFERLKEKEERLKVTEKELADIKENIRGKLLMNESAVETLRERERKISKSEKKFKSFQDSTVGMVFLNEHEVQTYQGFEMMWRKNKQELEGLKESMKGKVLVNNQDLKEWTVELGNARSIVEKYGSFEDFEEKFHSLETATVEKDEIIKTLEDELNYLEKIKKEEIKKKDCDIASLQKLLSEVESKLASNEKNSTQVITGLEERIKDATKENDSIKQHLSSLEDEERKLNKELETLRKRDMELSRSLETSSDEKQHLQKEITSLKKSISSTDGKIADAMASIEKENSELRRQISKINDEKRQLCDQNDETMAKLKDSQDSLEEVNSSMKNLNSLFCSLQLERDDLEISKEKLTIQISTKESEIKEVRMELDKLIELEQQVEKLKKENASQKYDYEEKLNESNHEIEAATCERESALKHLSDLRKEHFSLENELTSVRLDLAENEAKDKRIESLENICSKLRQDMYDMRENQDDMIHNLDGNLHDVTQKNNDLMNQLNILKKTNMELDQEMNDLKSSYTEKYEQDIIKSKNDVEELEKLKEENLALVELVKTKVAEYEVLEKEYNCIKKKPSTTSDLEQCLSVADERIRTLEDLVLSLTKEKDRYAENVFKTELKYREATKRQHQLEKRMKAQSKLLSKAESVMAETNAATLNTVMAALDKTNI